MLFIIIMCLLSGCVGIIVGARFSWKEPLPTYKCSVERLTAETLRYLCFGGRWTVRHRILIYLPKSVRPPNSQFSVEGEWLHSSYYLDDAQLEAVRSALRNWPPVPF